MESEYKIKAIKRTAEIVISVGNVASLMYLYRKIEEATGEKIQEAIWINLKDKLISLGEYSVLSGLYCGRWPELCEKDQYKKDMFACAKNALVKGEIGSYINAIREAGKRINRKSVALILEKNNFEYFNDFGRISVSKVVRYYSDNKQKIPTELLKKIQKENSGRRFSSSLSNYMWACRKLKVEPSLSVLIRYYNIGISENDIHKMIEAKEAIGQKIPKDELIKFALKSKKLDQYIFVGKMMSREHYKRELIKLSECCVKKGNVNNAIEVLEEYYQL